MKRSNLLIIQISGFGLLLLCVSEVGRAANQTPWAQKMRKLEASFQELLVDLSSDDRFNSSKNFKRIEKNADQFAELAHQLKSGPMPTMDSDPSIKILAGEFANEAKQAAVTLKSGHREYARGLLKSMTGYCMACHTRTSSGPSFQSASLVEAAKSLRSLERANFFASARQFDRALDEYEKILSSSSSVEHHAFDWERATRSGLAIAVRVKNDPDRALSIVDRVLATPKAPFFLKEQALDWRKSILAWKQEPQSQPQTVDGYYSKAIKLVSQARELQKYPADRSADIVYLRASSAVHELLGKDQEGVHTAEGLFLAGLCYEVLNDLNLWDQHEFYYLACIKKAPHTETARGCFRHYEQSVYLGYTGSGGTSLPADVRVRLNELQQLSAPVQLH